MHHNATIHGHNEFAAKVARALMLTKNIVTFVKAKKL